MVYSLISIVSLFLAANSADHDFYVSLTYLKVLDGDQLEIKHRTFKDDLELAIRDYQHDQSITLDTSYQNVIASYLSDMTSLEVNQQKMTPEFVDLQIEGDGATCTVECTLILQLLPGAINQLTYQSHLLLDQYDDQINMVHFISDQARKSKNLDAKIRTFTIF